MRDLLQSVLVCTAVACTTIAMACTTFAFATMQQPSSVVAGSNAKQRGAELFATRGCAHCHGPAGVGGAEGPDLQLVRKRMNKAQIALQIHNGGKSMPAYGDILSPTQINDLVAYLRASRKIIPVAPHPIPAEGTAPAAAPSDPG